MHNFEGDLYLQFHKKIANRTYDKIIKNDEKVIFQLRKKMNKSELRPLYWIIIGIFIIGMSCCSLIFYPEFRKGISTLIELLALILFLGFLIIENFTERSLFKKENKIRKSIPQYNEKSEVFLSAHTMTDLNFVLAEKISSELVDINSFYDFLEFYIPTSKSELFITKYNIYLRKHNLQQCKYIRYDKFKELLHEILQLEENIECKEYNNKILKNIIN